MPDSFTDHRGKIQDLLGPVDAVTEIFTKAGMTRGNHIHQHTTQFTYVCWGELQVAWVEDDGIHVKDYGPGSLIKEAAGVAHAWKATSDAMVLVLTRGPRSGDAYEADTHRLEVPILT